MNAADVERGVAGAAFERGVRIVANDLRVVGRFGIRVSREARAKIEMATVESNALRRMFLAYVKGFPRRGIFELPAHVESQHARVIFGQIDLTWNEVHVPAVKRGSIKPFGDETVRIAGVIGSATRGAVERRVGVISKDDGV